MKKTRAFGLASLVAAGSAFIACTPGSLIAAAGLIQPATPVAPAVTPAAPAPADAAATTPAKDVPIFVRAVQGKVQVREKPGTPLKKVDVGMVLSQGAELYTATKSAVQIQIGAGQIFTVDFNTRVILREVVNASGTEKTSIDMPYGRITFDVTSTQVANDVTITAPDATLAVKGTSGGLQSRPGFGTTAFGGVLNKGLFDVQYDSRVVASITGSETSSAKDPSPASFERQNQFVDTAADSSRETSETQALQTQGISSPIINTTPAPRVVNADNDIVKPDGTLFGDTFLDLGSNGSQVLNRDLFGNQRRVRTFVSGVQGLVQGATVIVGLDGQRTLLIVDNVFSANGNTPTLRALSLDNPSATSYTTVGSVPPVAGGFGGFTSYTFFGLGAIENRLFAGGVDSNFNSGIYELNVGDLGNIHSIGNFTTSLITGIDAQLQPAMATAPNRGTVFVIGTPNGNGGGGPPPVNPWVLYEVNPISGTIVNTRSTDAAGGNDFASQPSTQATPGLTFNDVQVISGMAYVNGILVMSGLTSGGRTVTVYYNPDAANTASDPTVRVIDGSAGAFASGALATESPLISLSANSGGQNLQLAQIVASAGRPLQNLNRAAASRDLSVKSEKDTFSATHRVRLDRSGDVKGGVLRPGSLKGEELAARSDTFSPTAGARQRVLGAGR